MTPEEQIAALEQPMKLLEELYKNVEQRVKLLEEQYKILCDLLDEKEKRDHRNFITAYNSGIRR